MNDLMHLSFSQRTPVAAWRIHLKGKGIIRSALKGPQQEQGEKCAGCDQRSHQSGEKQSGSG